MGYLEDNAGTRELLPDENLDICKKNLRLFFKTMYERQEIWYKRHLNRRPPWTENEILRDYKFTNVYRELDRNSQFQINNILKVETDRKELIWKLMFFRFFNNPEFFEAIEKYTRECDEYGSEEFQFIGMIPSYDKFDLDELFQLMRIFREYKGNPFTNAYLTNSQACPGSTRDECFAFKVIPTLHAMIPQIAKITKMAKEPEEIIKLLLQLPSVSNFMAHEFYQDFTYAERYSDIQIMRFTQNDYTNVGPGAEAGIRLIFPNRKTSREKLEAIYDLRNLASEFLQSHGNFKYLGYEDGEYVIDYDGDVTLHQIEMWLCEFQKYWKMKVGIGKQRSRFIPRKPDKNSKK